MRVGGGKDTACHRGCQLRPEGPALLDPTKLLIIILCRTFGAHSSRAFGSTPLRAWLLYGGPLGLLTAYR